MDANSQPKSITEVQIENNSEQRLENNIFLTPNTPQSAPVFRCTIQIPALNSPAVSNAKKHEIWKTEK